MRRTTAVALALVAALAPAAHAKFGITKTKVTLPRLRPPDRPLVAETVAVEVHASGSEIGNSHLSIVKGRLQDGLEASGLYKLVDRSRKADAVVGVDLAKLEAEVRDEVRMEVKYQKVGEREEWDSKKNKNVTKDVYKNVKVPVTWRIAEGSIVATMSIDGRTADVGSTYHQEFQSEKGIPPEASTEDGLRRFLVQGAANHAAALVCFSPDPVEALLAVDGDLKPGNRLAEAGVFPEALKEWNRVALKGDKEAARMHNLGVAHEAIAYSLPPDSPEHQSHLEEARERYRRALTLDPGEKYFAEPLQRIDISLQYAEAARALSSDLRSFKEKHSGHRAH